ncbi:hypothetical protein M3P05_13975 [Sansalvadorimonas sp. 2012CJ34-2]|uniref:Secreted protein n=1 Tax=Parendozoicomonas callyspongiae TaxID=2942213 RepID=A0ABT0PI58_9GAMM|nr:hypothetical protein [Sansalvadorimonas sp. 2012CJ34-2]MCL6271035.1 hypothetical protein [Sansalvadorimonas sp. 2012CJ34-2]
MKAGVSLPSLFFSFFLSTVSITLSLQASTYEHQGYESPSHYLPEEDDLDEYDENGYQGFQPQDGGWDNSDDEGYEDG